MASPISPSKHAPISLGILCYEYQALDCVGPLDLLSSCSHALFSKYFPHLASSAIPITFHHIGLTISPVQLYANISINPTCTIDTCPPLTHLLVGGPDPGSFTLDPAFSKFIQDHVSEGKGLFATCTGALAISESGVLDGRKATVNWGILEVANKVRPQVEWVKERWVEGDGGIWTAGGACAGMDMIAKWIVKNYGAEVAKVGFEGWIMRGGVWRGSGLFCRCQERLRCY